MTRLRVLYAVAGALALPALVLQAVPGSLPSVAASPIPLPAGSAGARPDRASQRTDDPIVAANPFSTRRAPPAVRFVPAGGAHRARTLVLRPSGPKLYGITLGPDGAVAVISADPGVRRAELFGIGDTVAGARVVAISESTVTLARPSGAVTLHLEFAGHHLP